MEWGCGCDGPEVGSSLEVGLGWCHLAGEVGQVGEMGGREEWGKGKG